MPPANSGQEEQFEPVGSLSAIDPGYTCDIHSNHPNNFYLPNTRMERGELTNYDAKYLMACAEVMAGKGCGA